jgi:hypothetical protein
MYYVLDSIRVTDIDTVYATFRFWRTQGDFLRGDAPILVDSVDNTMSRVGTQQLVRNAAGFWKRRGGGFVDPRMATEAERADPTLWETREWTTEDELHRSALIDWEVAQEREARGQTLIGEDRRVDRLGANPGDPRGLITAGVISRIGVGRGTE